MRSGHFVLERVSKYFECLQSSNPFHTHFLLFRKWQEFPNNYLWFIFSIVVYFWALLSSILSCCPISFGLFLDLCSSVPFGLVECIWLVPGMTQAQGTAICHLFRQLLPFRTRQLTRQCMAQAKFKIIRSESEKIKKIFFWLLEISALSLPDHCMHIFLMYSNICWMFLLLWNSSLKALIVELSWFPQK